MSVAVGVKTGPAFDFGRRLIDDRHHGVIRQQTTLRAVVVNDVTQAGFGHGRSPREGNSIIAYLLWIALKLSHCLASCILFGTEQTTNMKNRVSYENLTPLSFLERSAFVYPDKPAVIYDDRVYTYGHFEKRVRRLAAALRDSGVEKGDRVAFLAPNVPQMLEAHFAPMRIGAILVAINTRLAAREIAYILNHSGAKVLVFDSELAPTVRALRNEVAGVTSYVQIVDTAPKAEDIPGPDYESFLAAASEDDSPVEAISERDSIAINYTSGTTGFPKGVEFHARGAYLNALGEALEVGLNPGSVYLWTVPMFHCNGWCFTWAVTAVGATHICLRRVDPPEVYRLIKERALLICAAPRRF